MDGWIKDYRRELDSSIWQMPPLYHRVWQWLKYQANHKDQMVPMRDGRAVLVKRGQRLTSYRQIAEGVTWYERGLARTPNTKTITEIIKWLYANGMIEKSESNRKYTVITICNYSLYQGEELNESNSSPTVRLQTLDTNKNDKKEKNEKKKEKRLAVTANSIPVIDKLSTEEQLNILVSALNEHWPDRMKRFGTGGSVKARNTFSEALQRHIAASSILIEILYYPTNDEPSPWDIVKPLQEAFGTNRTMARLAYELEQARGRGITVVTDEHGGGTGGFGSRNPGTATG